MVFNKSNFLHLNCCHTPCYLCLSIQNDVSYLLLYNVLFGCFHSPRPIVIHGLRPSCTLRNATIQILCVVTLAVMSRSFLTHRRLRPSVSPTGTIFEQQPTMLKNKIYIFCVFLPIQLLCIPPCICSIAATLVHTLDLIVNATEF